MSPKDPEPDANVRESLAIDTANLVRHHFGELEKGLKMVQGAGTAALVLTVSITEGKGGEVAQRVSAKLKLPARRSAEVKLRWERGQLVFV